MLFLGAGASKAFNLPDLEELTQLIMKKINDYEFADKIKDLKNILDNEYLTSDKNSDSVDIEILLTVLNYLNLKNETFNPPLLLLKNLNKNQIGKLTSEEFEQFKKLVQDSLIEKLTINDLNSEITTKILNEYSKLLSIL